MVEIYHAEGRYREAEPLIARALRIHEQSLGSEHPYMAYSLSNQAKNFFLRGDYVQAESQYKKALAIREQNLGFDHPRTASTYYDLAKLYSASERYEEAEALYRKALSIRERAFGPDHPAVASTLEQYATVHKKAEKRERGTWDWGTYPSNQGKTDRSRKLIRARKQICHGILTLFDASPPVVFSRNECFIEYFCALLRFNLFYFNSSTKLLLFDKFFLVYLYCPF